MNDDRPEKLEEFLRGSLNRLPNGDGSLGTNVIAAIRGRTPVQMGVIAQLPKANAVAALFLVAGCAFAPPSPPAGQPNFFRAR